MRSALRAPLAVATLGLGAPVLALAVASCADSEVEGAAPANDSRTIPSADGDAGPDVSDGCAGDADVDACPNRDGACEHEWCPVTTPLDPDLGLASVWGSGPSDVWAVGAAGSVLHWDGTAWTAASVGTSQALYAVWGTGPNDVWIASSPGVIFRKAGDASGAAQWSSTPAIVEAPGARGKVLRALWGTSPSDVWVGGDLFASAQSSTRWGLWRSGADDGAAPWTGIAPRAVSAIWGSGPNDVWIVGGASGDAGPSSAHTNGALTESGLPAWSAVDTQSTGTLHAVWGSGPSDVWAVGDFGTIRHGGAGRPRWSVVASPTTKALRGVWGSAPDDVWAVGDDGTLLHYDGVAWEASTAAFPSGIRPRLFGVWGSGPSDVWAVGDGLVLHYSGPKARARGAGR